MLNNDCEDKINVPEGLHAEVYVDVILMKL